ncbi:MAG: hypothetical protein IKH56_10470 [Oscillospiraceae bacterium]|nr:hypothetical protein [Oscillospiraceae bacterium]
MQRSNALIRVVFCLFLAAILAYFGFYIYRTFVHPLKTVQAVSATVSDAVSADGYIVREEKVLTASGVVSPVEDGKKIAAHGVVAVCYTNESALEQADRILALQERIAALQTALGETETASPAAVVADLSAAVASRRFDRLDTLASQARYVLFGTSSSVEQAQQELEEARRELETLQSMQSGYSLVTADSPGLFSSVVDGYESVSPADLDSLTPGRLLLLFDGTRVRNGFGKLISGTRWYYACVMDSARAAELAEGRSVTLEFTDGYTKTVSMQIVSVSSADTDGNCAAVFVCDTGLADVSAVRRASANVVFSRSTGILVPDEAVCDPDSRPHVFVLAGLQAHEVEVEILVRGEDGFTLVSAPEGSMLSAGVTVITTTEGLSDGKVVR